ncbi:hypothetical protein PI125_g12112 [Phytophthora idaei]|nr:hypothetical protein PI125_g12112 [Phytophthora idaei]
MCLGCNHADLKLNARLCHLLEMRFPEVMTIPAGEFRRVQLSIHPRQDGSATSPIATVSSGATLATSSKAPVASVSAASSADGPASSASLPQRPLRTLDQLRRDLLSTLTPKEQLGRYANPKSPTAAGSCRCPSAPPPPQPYACPSSDEAGHEEISALLGSSLPQEAMSDGEVLCSPKTSRRTRQKKTCRLRLSSTTQSAISAFSENDTTGLSDWPYEFEMP